MGSEKRRIREDARNILEREGEKGNDISREEVNGTIERLKRNQATGENGMENKALKYRGEGVREEIQETI